VIFFLFFNFFFQSDESSIRAIREKIEQLASTIRSLQQICIILNNKSTVLECLDISRSKSHTEIGGFLRRREELLFQLLPEGTRTSPEAE
jgi:hypothetical protein